MDLKSYLRDPTSLPCSCHLSEFKDPHHQHIITGDLSIVENIKLRKLLSRGPKYRESKQLNFELARKEILKGIDKCIDTYCDRHRLNKAVLHAWRTEVLKGIDDRIKTVVPSLKIDPVSETLKDPACRRYLANLHEKFVIAPIDKATGNVSLICKRFYADVLVKELGLKGEKSSTYQSIWKKDTTIIACTKSDLKSKFDIDLDNDNVADYRDSNGFRPSTFYG